METINSNNYEAFYLDFLEGNLNEEDTALLFVFLDKNPELKLDETEFISLEDNSSSLDNLYKQSLKQVLVEEENVTILNVNSFLIAQTEKQLSPAKEKQLEEFIASNPIYLKDQNLFQAAHLKANLEEVYSEKNALKKARKLTLWPFISFAIAASIALLISFGNFFIKDPLPLAHIKKVTSNDAVQLIKPIHSTSEKITVEKVKSIKLENNTTSTPLIAKNNSELNKFTSQTTEDKNHETVVVKRLKSLKIKHFEFNDDFSEPLKAKGYSKPIKVRSCEDSYTNLGFNQMQNPIIPITSKLSELVKKDVDFRTAKATAKHSGGFYIKIGKLVISHTKS